MLYRKRTTILCMLLKKVVREPMRRVPHNPRLPSRRGLHSVLQHQPLSFAHQKKNPAKTGFRKAFTVALPKGTTSQGSSRAPPSNMPCWNCNKTGHWARECPYPKKNNYQGGRQGQVNHTNITEIPSGEVVTAGKFLIDQHPAVVLFDSGASHSFISPSFASKFMQKTYTVEGEGYCIRAASGIIPTKLVVGMYNLR